MGRRPPQLTLEVRLGELAEVGSLAAIERAAGERFRSVGLDAIADDDPFPDDVLADAVAERRLWVAVLGGDLVGYAFGDLLPGGGGGSASASPSAAVRPHLEQVSVLPEAGGRGVGAALVGEVAAWARAVGGEALTLTTFRDLAWNRPWYERLGFTVVPEVDLDGALRSVRAHEAELGIDVAPRVVMRLDLGRPLA